jgi:probable biosynthetic protein (TIGR04098 family)
MQTGICKEYGQLVNMPQMALTGLSESWLMKEIGNLHWHMLCDDLGVKSNEIFDEFGNRLYATFVRITVEGNSSLKDFKENDYLHISGNIKQINSMLYCSTVKLDCAGKLFVASLTTSFTSRDDDTDNTKLTKGVPRKGNNKINTISDMPKHVLEIIKYKKSTIHNICLCDHNFDLTDISIFQQSYNINPYTDINGVGLLYYAAYPLISDVCELEYFNKTMHSQIHWALRSATMSRDIIYLGNCNISDVIYYDLNSCQTLSANKVALQSTLRRKSDNAPIAKLFTIKQMLNSNR